MIISEEEKIFIEEHLVGGENLIEEGDAKELLRALHAWITQFGFDGDYNLTEDGEEAEEVFASISIKNKEFEEEW